jgi:hypothetical protein
MQSCLKLSGTARRVGTGDFATPSSQLGQFLLIYSPDVRQTDQRDQMKRIVLLAVAAFVCLTHLAFAAPEAPLNLRRVPFREFFAAPNGSANNSGTLESPWPLTYALTRLAPGVTLTLLPGVYTGPFAVANAQGSSTSPITIRAQSKWQAVIANSASSGISASSSPGYQSTFVVFDGLCISNNAADGIGAWRNTIIRNCWIVRNGMQGVNLSSPTASSNVVEYCLIENNGANTSWPGHFHGIYVNGPGNVIRGNVVRRNNTGFGIHLYAEDQGAWNDSNWFYANLVYGHTSQFGVTMWNANEYGGGTLRGTNYLFGNTILDGVQLAYGTACLTNNIILPSPRQPTMAISPSTTRPPVVWADYNMSTRSLPSSGSHNVVTANIGFTYPDRGLYWLTAASPARNSAHSGAVLPADFFGSPNSPPMDIGAFQYRDQLANDVRTLDPSPANPDYWASP